MFDFWDIAGKALQGGVSAFLNTRGGSSKSVTDNSSINTGGTTNNKVTPGKAKAAPITEGVPQYNQGGGINMGKAPGFDSNFDWNGRPFYKGLSDFLDDYEGKDDK